MFCAGNAHPYECLVGRLIDTAPEEWRNRYADFSRSPKLRRLDRFFDPFAIDSLHQFLFRHYHDPLAPPPPDRPPPPPKPPPPPPNPPPPPRPPDRILNSKETARLGFVMKTNRMIKPMNPKRINSPSENDSWPRRPGACPGAPGTPPPPITVITASIPA